MQQACSGGGGGFIDLWEILLHLMMTMMKQKTTADSGSLTESVLIHEKCDRALRTSDPFTIRGLRCRSKRKTML